MKTLLTVAVLIVVAQAYPGSKIKFSEQSNEEVVTYNVDRTHKTEGRLINGTVAKHGQFPHQAALYFDSKKICGGSLISRRWVLTTALCAYQATSVTVHLGAQDLNEINTEEGRVTIQTSEIILYPSYNFSANQKVNSIALINLGEDVHISKYIQAVPLASGSNLYMNSQVRVTGWGRNSSFGIMSSVLKYVDMNVTSCELYYAPHESQMCAKAASDGGICLEDEGGALIDLYSGKQIGIASFFSGAGCQAGIPDGFTRITTFTSWIAINTGIHI